MPITLLYLPPEEVAEEDVTVLRHYLHETPIVVTHDMESINSLWSDITIAAGRVTPEMVKSMPNVKWVHHWAAGIDAFFEVLMLDKTDFLMTTGSGVHGVPVSEHVFGMILAFTRKLHDAIRAQGHHRWNGEMQLQGHSLLELAGKTMLIVGVGAIGKHVARISQAFGMNVTGVRNHPAGPVPFVNDLVGPEDLLSVLPKSDFVVLTAPLTPKTRGMIGVNELQAMKPTAYLINVGRGQLVDELVLVNALKNGWIAGAGLDVFELEPLPENSPLWEMPNVILTSHYAGSTTHYNARAMAIFIENVKRYVKGESLLNLVDRNAYY